MKHLPLSILLICLLILQACKKDTDEVKPTIRVVEQNLAVLDTLIVNPSGYAPLSALYQFNSQVPLKSELIIQSKNQSIDSIHHQFNDFTREHRIPILGLYADYKNQVLIRFYNESNQLVLSKPFEIETPPLSVNLPNIVIENKVISEMAKGFTLVSYWGLESFHMPFIFDSMGEIRWYLNYENHPQLNQLNYDNGIEQLANGNFYFGDINTNQIYEVDCFGAVINQWSLGMHIFHHDVMEKKDGNFLVTTSKTNSTHLNGQPTIEDYVIELDRSSGQIIREWDLKVSLDEYRTALIDDLSNPPVDWFHGNAVTESDNLHILVSGRTQGLVKLSQNNQLRWIISPQKGWGVNRNQDSLNAYLLQPLDANGLPIQDTAVINGSANHTDFEWPWYQHAQQTLPSGNIIMFDNGDNRNYTGQVKYSRAVEYKIDEQNMTIQQVWSYGKQRGNETYSQVVSDVDYLESADNVLFCPGFAPSIGNGIGGRIVEIDYSTKDVVFQAQINPPSGVFVTFHRAERLKLYQ